METTTLNEIRKYKPCVSGWNKLLASLNKTAADDEPLPFVDILKSNGIDDAIWALRTRPKLAIKFGCRCAEAVLPIFEARFPDDPRPREAIAAARRGDSYVAADAAHATRAAHEASYVAVDAAGAHFDRTEIFLRVVGGMKSSI